jgi:hypothetical protein
MGLLINNELIWISIPRCASVSIENAFLNSNLNIKRLKVDLSFENTHMHFEKSILYEEFGIHETICIKRDWFDKWISSLYQIFYWLNTTKVYTPIIEWENVDNDFIYNTFDTDFVNAIYKKNTENWDIAFLRIIKEKSIKEKVYDSNGNIMPNVIGILSTLLSQNFYKDNKPADYEFDISELDKFSNFIYDRFGERLNIQRLNERKNIPNKIIIDDKLKQWIWDKFEKPFKKRNSLI